MLKSIRLKHSEIIAIKAIVHALDINANIYLFGSRVDPKKNGGDIDLIIISQTITAQKKLELLIAFKNKLGEQKIDLIIKTDEAFASDIFCQSLTTAQL